MPNFTIEFQAMGSHIQAWLWVPIATNASILTQVPLWFEAWEAIAPKVQRAAPARQLKLADTKENDDWVEF